MATSSEDFDSCKENIQPLKEGRNKSKLETALHAQNDDSKFRELVKEKEKFETLIRTYNGEDPLQLWCDYVLWVEQSFPTNSQHGNLSILLEKCLSYFKDKKEYFDDIRLIKLWIKYMEYSHNSLEMFTMIYSHGIGRKTTLFYRWWAYEYEREENFKKADRVYLLGLKNQAQPIDELEYAHKQFEIKVGQISLGNSINFSEPPIPKREVLASLKSVSSISPQLSQGASSNKGRQNIGDNRQRCNMKIFQDENSNYDQLKIDKQHLTTVPEIKSVIKENIQVPGPWNNKNNNNPTASYIPRERQQFHLEVFEDASSQDIHKCMTTNLDVLKAKSNVGFTSDTPICKDNPDPSTKPMYPKHLIYAGGEEFQLEEIMYLLRSEKEKKEKNLVSQCNVVKNPQNLQTDLFSQEISGKLTELTFPNEGNSNSEKPLKSVLFKKSVFEKDFIASTSTMEKPVNTKDQKMKKNFDTNDEIFQLDKNPLLKQSELQIFMDDVDKKNNKLGVLTFELNDDETNNEKRKEFTIFSTENESNEEEITTENKPKENYFKIFTDENQKPL